MTVVLRTLSENLSEKSDTVPPPALPSTTAASSDSVSNKDSQGFTGPASSKYMLLLCCLYADFFFWQKSNDQIEQIMVAHLQGIMEIINNVWICALIAS